MEKIRGLRFKGLTWEERETIVDALLKERLRPSMIASILSTSRQQISTVIKRIKAKNGQGYTKVAS